MSFLPDLFFVSLFILLLSWPFQFLQGQTHLAQYINSARVNSPQIIRLQKQIRVLELGKKSIKALYEAPKGYISSNINLTPYFNNNGILFTTNPSPNAIGYDIGITNGGLYSALMNVDIPVFARKSTQNALFWQDQKIGRLKILLKNLYFNLNRQVTGIYFTTLGIQLSYLTQQESVRLLSGEVKVMAQLTRKGSLTQNISMLSLPYPNSSIVFAFWTAKHFTASCFPVFGKHFGQWVTPVTAQRPVLWPYCIPGDKT